jgi:hypothetical protein
LVGHRPSISQPRTHSSWPKPFHFSKPAALLIETAFRYQGASSSRRIAGLSGFLTLTHALRRPDR